MLLDAATDALVLVDVQNDFCPGGALPVPEGDRVVPVLNTLLDHRELLAVATRDWHPPDHTSFATQGGPWPVHCVAGTPGAGFHPGLHRERLAHMVSIGATVSKATARDQEAYSGFQGTGLAVYLHQHGIRRLFIGGLATDYCVKATALDARQEGFEVFLLTDAIRAVDVQPGDGDRAIAEMQAAGVTPIKSTDLEFPTPPPGAR
jgi:nicotinamidase/pyrazinamidase